MNKYNLIYIDLQLFAKKNYNGIDYDDKTDYAAEINKAKASGASQDVIDGLTKQREAKIAGENLNNDGSKKTSTGSTKSGNSTNLGNTTQGRNYVGRQTAYIWDDGGTSKTLYSTGMRYDDVLAEAIRQGILSNDAKLSKAYTYATKSGDKGENEMGDITISLTPSKSEATGRNAFADALAHAAMASSSSNAWNKGKTLDSYYGAMDDFYNYYNSLTPEEQYALERGDFTGSVYGGTLTAIRALQNGYTPTGITSSTSGIPVTDSMMKAEEYPEYLQNLLAEVRGTAGGAGTLPMYVPTTNAGGYMDIGGNIISTPMASGKPTYESKYDEDIDELLAQILNRGEFSYDLESDPLYQQIKSQFAREGQRAMNDTLASAASGAGGMNSYAISAANQANNNFMTQLGDLMPTLYQQAYGMYADDFNRDVTAMGLLQGLEDTNYGMYRDDMNDYYADRDFNYNAWRDSVADNQWQTQFDYGVSRDALEDARYETDNAYSQAMAFLSSGVMPSSSLLSAAGISENDARNLLGAKNAKASTGGGNSSTTPFKPTNKLETLEDLIAKGVESDKINEEYYYYTGAYPEYDYEAPKHYDSNEGGIPQRIVLESLNNKKTADEQYEYIDRLYADEAIGKNNYEYFNWLISTGGR